MAQASEDLRGTQRATRRASSTRTVPSGRASILRPSRVVRAASSHGAVVGFGRAACSLSALTRRTSYRASCSSLSHKLCASSSTLLSTEPHTTFVNPKVAALARGGALSHSTRNSRRQLSRTARRLLAPADTASHSEGANADHARPSIRIVTRSTTQPNKPLQPTVTRPPTGPSAPAGSRQRLNAGR